MIMHKRQGNKEAPLSIFISYAHEDEPLRQQLESHLSLLRRQGWIADWHDRQILAGGEWARAIDQHLETASIILLLISPDFLASDYCYNVEMQQALKRHKRGEARIIPIILRPCHWEEPPISTLHALPTENKPVTTWVNRDEAWLDVEQGIRKVVEALLSQAILPSPLSSSSVESLSQIHLDMSEIMYQDELKILRHIHYNDPLKDYRVFRPTKKDMHWRSVSYYTKSKEWKKHTGPLIFGTIFFVTILLGILATVMNSGIVFLVGYSILLVTGYVIIGIRAWRVATKSVLVITPDRFFWGNWQKEYVEKSYPFEKYKSLYSNRKRLVGRKEREVWEKKFREMRKVMKKEYISLPSLFEFPQDPASPFGPSEDLALIIDVAYTQFLLSNPDNT
jgi:TIR domain